MTSEERHEARYRRRMAERQRRREELKKFRRWVDEGTLTREDVRTAYESWRGHMRRGNSWKVLRRMDKYYRKLYESGDWRDNHV